MISHEAISVDLPTRLATRFAEGFEEPLAIAVIAKDRFTTVATIHQVINRSGVLHSQLSGHVRSVLPPPGPVNGKICDYAGLTPI